LDKVWWGLALAHETNATILTRISGKALWVE
jgi:hypothetical protein